MQKLSIEGQGEINSLLVSSNLKSIYAIALTIFIIPSALCNLNLKTHKEQRHSSSASECEYKTSNQILKMKVHV